MPHIKILVFLFLINLGSGFAQADLKEYTLNGYVKDAASGETLIGANVSIESDPELGTISNKYGFYSITLKEGSYILVCSYLGYQDTKIELDLNEKKELDFNLSSGLVLRQVVVSDIKDRAEDHVENTQMGKIELPVAQLSKMPNLLGEVDILKTLQLLPGVLSSEGSSGFYVRGGGPDQNLILLDEAVVYNSGHLLGFFSIFNADAIKKTELIKGGAPANYGGRLSSVVDITMKDGNNKKWMAEGGIGLISSRLTLQGPILKEKISFLVSARRTYAMDLAQPFIDKSDFTGTNYYFYDLNAKLNYKVSSKDRLFLSGYFGRDVLKLNQASRDFNFNLPYGNATMTFRWNHLWNEKLFFNLSAIYNDYNFQMAGSQDAFSFKVRSGVRDYNLKLDFDYYPNASHNIKFGLNSVHHKLSPNSATAVNGEFEFEGGFQTKYALESGIYFLDEWKVSKRFSLNLGTRFGVFTQLGPFNSSLPGQSATGYTDAIVTYNGLEPRINFKYSLGKEASIKGGFTYANQYLHLVSNSTSTLPTDIWVPSTKTVKPQRAVQYALGYFKNLSSLGIEASLEAYYRNLSNQIDYAEDYVNDLSDEEEAEFVFGKGRAYGMELFLKKGFGDWNGWIGYTLSKSERSFDDIESGRWFPNVHDKTHDLSVVANYKISDKWDFSGVLVYGTGKNYTPIEGFFFIENVVHPYFGPRNGQRLDAYHRIDLSLNWTPGDPNKKGFKSSYNFSVYNAYNRKNPFFVYFDTQNKPDVFLDIDAYKVTIFPIIPSISWNFKWNQ